jgi:hypothetical protein
MDEPIEVECYAGAAARETPRAVARGGRRREVTRVLKRWIEERRDPAAGRRWWYELEFQDGGSATIYYDLALDMWFLRRDIVTDTPLDN